MQTPIDPLRAGFEAQFGHPARLFARAPGRLEILGNHTDYNEGVVLSVAVDRAAFVAIAPSADPTSCRLHDLREDSRREFRLSDLDTPTPGDWANYVRGLLVELRKRGIDVPGFDLALHSTVPLSAGMSSSAALEMSALTALDALNGLGLPWIDMAKIGQACENQYVGANTGLLDQFSSLRGEAGRLVYSDFRSLEVDTVPFPQSCALVVANTNVKHVLTGAYNERRERCEQAVRELRNAGFSDIAALRDVSSEQLESAADHLDVTALRRARHVVTEDERVFEGIEDLKADRIEAFGEKLFASHESSRVDFENSCGELDMLVETARSLPACHGARLSGGGFGGITVHLVEADGADRYAERLATAYRSRTGADCEPMICRPGDGACVLDC
jgi:galactokinase